MHMKGSVCCKIHIIYVYMVKILHYMLVLLCSPSVFNLCGQQSRKLTVEMMCAFVC